MNLNEDEFIKHATDKEPGLWFYVDELRALYRCILSAGLFISISNDGFHIEGNKGINRDMTIEEMAEASIGWNLQQLRDIFNNCGDNMDELPRKAGINIKDSRSLQKLQKYFRYRNVSDENRLFVALKLSEENIKRVF